MDLFLITAGVAGLATAGAALASALYDIIASIHDAPREMIEIAQGIRELSLMLRELRRVINKSPKLLREQLFDAIASTTRKIRDTHDKVDQLLNAEGGLSRVIWSFQRYKATKLLATIESQKLNVQLMATTVSIALMQRERTDGKSRPLNSERILQREAKTLVETTERLLPNMSSRRQIQRDQCVQTKAVVQQRRQLSHVIRASAATDPDTAFALPQGHHDQLEYRDDSLDDTARWLHRLVLQTGHLTGPGQSISPDRNSIPYLLVPTYHTTEAPVVDMFLSPWTRSTTNEMQDISVGTGSTGESVYAKGLKRRLRLPVGRCSTSELPFMPTRNERGPGGTPLAGIRPAQRLEPRNNNRVDKDQLEKVSRIFRSSYGDEAENHRRETWYHGRGFDQQPPISATSVSDNQPETGRGSRPVGTSESVASWVAFAADCLVMARGKVLGVGVEANDQRYISQQRSRRSAELKTSVTDFQLDSDTRLEPSSPWFIVKRQRNSRLTQEEEDENNATEDEEWASERNYLLNVMRNEDPASPDDMKTTQFWEKKAKLQQSTENAFQRASK